MANGLVTTTFPSLAESEWRGGVAPVRAKNSIRRKIIDVSSEFVVACLTCARSSFRSFMPWLQRSGAGPHSRSRSSPSGSSSRYCTTADRDDLICDLPTASSGPAYPNCGQAGGTHSSSSSLTPSLPGPARASDCSGPGSPAEAGSVGPPCPKTSAISFGKLVKPIPLGRTSGTRRAIETWHQRLTAHRCQVHGAAPQTALPDVAYLPYQSRKGPGVRRFLQRARRNLPGLLRLHRARPRSSPRHPLQCHRATHSCMDSAANRRGVPPGHRTPLPPP